MIASSILAVILSFIGLLLLQSISDGVIKDILAMLMRIIIFAILWVFMNYTLTLKSLDPITIGTAAGAIIYTGAVMNMNNIVSYLF